MAKDLFAAMKGLGLLGPFLDGKSFSTDEIVGGSKGALKLTDSRRQSVAP